MPYDKQTELSVHTSTRTSDATCGPGACIDYSPFVDTLIHRGSATKPHKTQKPRQERCGRFTVTHYAHDPPELTLEPAAVPACIIAPRSWCFSELSEPVPADHLKALALVLEPTATRGHRQLSNGSGNDPCVNDSAPTLQGETTARIEDVWLECASAVQASLYATLREYARLRTDFESFARELSVDVSEQWLSELREIIAADCTQIRAEHHQLEETVILAAAGAQPVAELFADDAVTSELGQPIRFRESPAQLQERLSSLQKQLTQRVVELTLHIDESLHGAPITPVQESDSRGSLRERCTASRRPRVIYIDPDECWCCGEGGCCCEEGLDIDTDTLQDAGDSETDRTGALWCELKKADWADMKGANWACSSDHSCISFQRDWRAGDTSCYLSTSCTQAVAAAGGPNPDWDLYTKDPKKLTNSSAGTNIASQAMCGVPFGSSSNSDGCDHSGEDEKTGVGTFVCTVVTD